MEIFDTTHAPRAVDRITVSTTDEVEPESGSHVTHFLVNNRVLREVVREGLTVVLTSLQAVFTRCLMLKFPAYYAQCTAPTIPRSDADHDHDIGGYSWYMYNQDLTAIAGCSGVEATVTIALLQTSLGSSNNVAFTCGIVALIFASITAVFCATYYILIRQMQPGHIIGGPLSRSNTNIVLALPAVWLAWASFALLVFICVGILLANPGMPNDRPLPSGVRGSLGALFMLGLLHVAISGRQLSTLGQSAEQANSPLI